MNAPLKSEQWHAERRKGVGGSDVAAILGLSKFRTAYDVWLEKTGQAAPQEENEAMYWGTVLEDVVASEYSRRSGRKIQRVNKQLVHPSLPIARANIDRAVINPDIRGNVRWVDGRLTTDRLLECKTANAFTAHKWGETGTDDIPDDYVVQCQWYAGIARVETVDLAVLIGGSDFRLYTIAAVPALFDALLEAAARFWKLVDNGTPPDPQTLEDAKRLWPQHIATKTEIVGVQTWRDCESLIDIKNQIKVLEEEKKQVELRIVSTFGDAERIDYDGDRLATWKTQEAARIDAKALRAEHPDIADKFTTTSSTRVLRLAPSKKD